MESNPVTTLYSVAVFATDKGPGDAERASILSHAGTYLAKQNVRLICVADADGICVPLVSSARSAGGEVLVIADQGFKMPSALSGITVETIGDEAARMKRVVELSDAFMGLPGSLATVTSLYSLWVSSGSTKPVALLNKNRAYELMRGMAVDVFAHSIPNWEKKLQLAETIEDLWPRLVRVIS